MSTTATLVGVTGAVLNLDAFPFYLDQDPGFFGSPVVALSAAESGGLKSGDLPRQARHTARPVRCSILVEGADGTALQANIERLATVVNPTGGPVGRRVLLVVNRDGIIRFVAGRYESGLELVPIISDSDTMVRVDLVLRCNDPHWQGMDSTEVALDFPITGTGLTFTSFDDSSIAFSDPSTPFNGYTPTAEDGLITLNMENPGDVEAWPRWEVDGAFSAVEIAHLGTGETLRFEPAASIVSGETLVIDTNERAPSVRVDDVNRYVDLEAGSALFSLRPGRNIIAVQVTGNDTDTRFRAIYRGRHSTC